MVGMVSGAQVDFIDLTDSSPRVSDRNLPDDDLNDTTGLSRMRSKSTGSKISTPILLSDDDAGRAEANSGLDEPQKKEKKRRRREKKRSYGVGESGSATPIGESNLFFLDALPQTPSTTEEVMVSTSHTGDKSLVLPEHVTVNDANIPSNVVLASTIMAESDDDDFINYADAETATFTRYYEEPKDPAMSKLHIVCGHCGAEGDHKTSDCSVLVCLTCGAHNEHSTRQCPIVKTCYTCGIKGHVTRDCPNRFSRRLQYDEECDRCGSESHKTLECPTLWRIYKYLGQKERDESLKMREEAMQSSARQEFIGQSFYCYDCGDEGHLGDDCSNRASRMRDYSAFGQLNVLTGPFSEDREPSKLKTSGRRRENNGMFDDGHGFSGPSDVGKRGREKERERLKRREKEKDRGSDEDDWFSKGNGRAEKKPTRNDAEKGGGRNDKMAFKFSNKDRNGSKVPDKLAARLSSAPVHKEGKARHSEGRSFDRGPRYEDWKRDRERSQERHDNPRSRTEDGPRRQYYGGYGR